MRFLFFENQVEPEYILNDKKFYGSNSGKETQTKKPPDFYPRAMYEPTHVCRVVLSRAAITSELLQIQWMPGMNFLLPE